jgi:hypothetical protein
MDVEAARLFVEIVGGFGTIGVLGMWVVHAERRRIKLSDYIIEDWQELTRARRRNIEANLQESENEGTIIRKLG